MTKPKLSVFQAINKSFIVWGIKNDKKIRVYYKMELESRKHKVRIPCVIVDYNDIKREWHIMLAREDNTLKSCTIDDVTGMYSIGENKS